MRNKYGVAAKSDRTYNGKVYDSKLEMEYRKYLELLKNATVLKYRVIKIEEQVEFPVVVSGIKICTYYLDFKVTYADGRTPDHIDCKGFKTPEYRLKKKLVEALYPIKIKEIKKDEFKLIK